MKNRLLNISLLFCLTILTSYTVYAKISYPQEITGKEIRKKQSIPTKEELIKEKQKNDISKAEKKRLKDLEKKAKEKQKLADKKEKEKQKLLAKKEKEKKKAEEKKKALLDKKEKEKEKLLAKKEEKKQIALAKKEELKKEKAQKDSLAHTSKSTAKDVTDKNTNKLDSITKPLTKAEKKRLAKKEKEHKKALAKLAAAEEAQKRKNGKDSIPKIGKTETKKADSAFIKKFYSDREKTKIDTLNDTANADILSAKLRAFRKDSLKKAIALIDSGLNNAKEKALDSIKNLAKIDSTVKNTTDTEDILSLLTILPNTDENPPLLDNSDTAATTNNEIPSLITLTPPPTDNKSEETLKTKQENTTKSKTHKKRNKKKAKREKRKKKTAKLKNENEPKKQTIEPKSKQEIIKAIQEKKQQSLEKYKTLIRANSASYFEDTSDLMTLRGQVVLAAISKFLNANPNVRIFIQVTTVKDYKKVISQQKVQNRIDLIRTAILTSAREPIDPNRIIIFSKHNPNIPFRKSGLSITFTIKYE